MQKQVARALIKRYFLYHVPLVILASILVVLAFCIGPKTASGKALFAAGSIALLLAPLISLLLVKRQIRKLAAKSGIRESRRGS
uniref:Uncharacterized protein n=1 Tax=Fervidicoccus fontis TaxID=683846 RepID=A0A7J3ZIN0_9CREN